MSTEIYLGNPPENIVKWIKENYKSKVNYLCFTAEEANSTVKMSKAGSAPTVYLETSPTGEEGSWSDFTVGSTTITLANVGDKVYFRAKEENERFATSYSKYNYFVMTGKIAASGNLNTLLKADGSVLDLTGRDYCYYNMFRDCSSLTQAPELPATTLANSCYQYMFQNCTKLTKAPELPATTLADYCYCEMFGCTALDRAPELPATTLASNCYEGMFDNCTSLTQAPELSATALADYCYCCMFDNCTSLTQAPELPATTLAAGCYASMFTGCASLTQAPELPATTLVESCYEYMFYSCTSLIKAPELLATTLAEGCYRDMFSRCYSLTQAPELPATTLADSCYYSMFWNCKSLTQVPNIAKINSSSCGNMFYNTKNLEEITFTHMTTDEVVAIAMNACIGIPKGSVMCYCTDGIVVVGAGDDSSGSGS